jgi:hypothetical protein
MKRGILLLFLSGAILAAAFSNPDLVRVDDRLYEEVRRLALLAQAPPPPTVSPLSKSELLQVLKRIDPEQLSETQHETYRKLLSELANEPFASTSLPVGAVVGLEAYVHTNDEADEWRYTYPDRLSLLEIPIRVAPLDNLALLMDLAVRKNYPIYPSAETFVPDPISNVPSDARELEVQFPHLAVVSAAGERWSAQFGRGRVGFGLGETGSLLLGNHVEWYDYLLLQFHGDLAAYRALYVDLEGWKSASEPVLDRMFFAHRIELTPTPWLSLAATDGFIYEGLNIEMRYFNPLMILHSFFVPRYGNVILNFEFSVRPLSGLELWAHVNIDQLQSGYEKERGYGLTEPRALGFLAGAEYVMPLDSSWLTIGTEWVYLDPWMYIGRTLLQSFTYRRRVQAENARPQGAKIIVEKSLAYPAGPDHYSATLYGELDLVRDVTLRLELTHGAQGENKLGQTVEGLTEEQAQFRTPSGANAEYFVEARVSADARVTEFELWGLPVELRAGAIVDAMQIWNNDHIAGASYFDLQLAPFISAALRERP